MNTWVIDLLPRILDVREKAGWNATTLDSGSFCARMMCVIAELQELSEASVAERRLECADVAIYLIVILNDLHPATLREIAQMPLHDHNVGDAGVHAGQVQKYVVRAWEAWRRGHYDIAYTHLGVALYQMFCTAQALHVDLHAAVVDKTGINLGRPHRHGMKHPDT